MNYETTTAAPFTLCTPSAVALASLARFEHRAGAALDALAEYDAELFEELRPALEYLEGAAARLADEARARAALSARLDPRAAWPSKAAA